MKKGLPSLICTIIGLVLIIIAFFGPWYNISMSFSMFGMSGDVSEDMYLTNMHVEGDMMGQQMSESKNWEEVEAQGTSTVSIGFIFANTMYLVIIAIITAILAVLGAGMYVLTVSKGNAMKNLGKIFGIITFILALVAILYFMFTWTGQMEDASDTFLSMGGSSSALEESYGFWYGQGDAGNSISMGPGFSWYLIIIGGILMLLAAIILRKKIVPTRQPIQEMTSQLE